MNTEQRVTAVLARLEDNRAALVAARGAGPPCAECRYSSPTRMKGITRCAHLALLKHTFKITTGLVEQHVLETADKARAADGLCGPEAILFEPKNRLRAFAATPHGFAAAVFVGGAAVTMIGSLFGY